MSQNIEQKQHDCRYEIETLPPLFTPKRKNNKRHFLSLMYIFQFKFIIHDESLLYVYFWYSLCENLSSHLRVRAESYYMTCNKFKLIKLPWCLGTAKIPNKVHEFFIIYNFFLFFNFLCLSHLLLFVLA